MRKIVLFRKGVQPLCNTVRGQRVTSFFGKHISGLFPKLPGRFFLFILFCFPAFKHVCCFRRNPYRSAHAIFRRPFEDSGFRRIKESAFYCHDSFIKVQALPLQTHGFPSPASSVNKNVSYAFPFGRGIIEGANDLVQHLWLIVVWFLFRCFRWSRSFGSIVHDIHLLFCLVKNRGN